MGIGIRGLHRGEDLYGRYPKLNGLPLSDSVQQR